MLQKTLEATLKTKINPTQALIKYQQMRILVENLFVPAILILFNIIIALYTMINPTMNRIITFVIFTVFAILMQGLVIVYAKYWKGRI